MYEKRSDCAKLYFRAEEAINSFESSARSTVCCNGGGVDLSTPPSLTATMDNPLGDNSILIQEFRNYIRQTKSLYQWNV